jgi:putative nucleotidyltransferase with HDIG domain
LRNLTDRAWLEDKVVVYQGVLAGLAAILLGAALHAGWTLGSEWVVAGLAVTAAIAERSRVRIVATADASISLLPTVFAAAVFGPVAAFAIAATSFLGECPLLMTRTRRSEVQALGRPYLRWGVHTASRAITGGVAGFAAAGLGEWAPHHGLTVVACTAISAVTAETLDMCFAGVTRSIRGGGGWELVKTMAPVIVGYASIYTPVLAVLAVAYVEFSPLTLALFFVPALAAHRLFGLYQEQRRLAQELGQANELLEAANLSFATALVATLDARDRYTAGHSAAVAIYGRDIAERMGLPTPDVQLVHLAGLVHDIGKIGLPAGLLEKPGALTLEERRRMEQHAVIGERILANVDSYSDIAAIVRHHHERFDGTGYPDCLAGDDIPLLARIVAVADAYNAMTSDRPYRDAMPSRVARLRLAQAVESQFDTSVVAAFEAVLAAASEDYRLARDEQFELERQGQVAARAEARTVISLIAHVS